MVYRHVRPPSSLSRIRRFWEKSVRMNAELRGISMTSPSVFSALSTTSLKNLKPRVSHPVFPIHAFLTIRWTDFVRYSDKYRPAVHAQLKESDLDPNFFPPDIWQRYFHPKIPVPAAQKCMPTIRPDPVSSVDGILCSKTQESEESELG